LAMMITRRTKSRRTKVVAWRKIMFMHACCAKWRRLGMHVRLCPTGDANLK
jgi:hypothetical protein